MIISSLLYDVRPKQLEAHRSNLDSLALLVQHLNHPTII